MRINVVGPTLLEESIETCGPYFRGTEAVPAKRVALAFSRALKRRRSVKSIASSKEHQHALKKTDCMIAVLKN